MGGVWRIAVKEYIFTGDYGNFEAEKCSCYW